MADFSAAERRVPAVMLAAALGFGACSPTAGQVSSQHPGPAIESPPAESARRSPSRTSRSSDLAYGTESAIKVVRQDRLNLGQAARICVETTLDPEARRIVEASGQPLDPRLVEEITYSTTIPLQRELHYRGWTQQGPRDRVIPYIDNPTDPTTCFDRSDTIQVRQKIVRGKSPLGYGVRLEATQGRRAYILAVERPYAVAVVDEIRGALDHRVTRIPDTQQPYWDPVRDVAVMADMFIGHLLEGSGETAESGTRSGRSLASARPKTFDPVGATPGEERMRRLTTAELESLVPGKRLIHKEPAGSTPDNLIVEEMFYKRPSASALSRGVLYSRSTRAYLVQYSSRRDGGDYLIRDNAICIIFARVESQECRSLFKDNTGYYISGHYDSKLPVIVVQIN